MIKFMKSWCEGIIVAIMISLIIEMILPEGNNKKYVKVVIGIYILFVILNPILENINKEFDFQNILSIDTVEVSTDFNDDMKDVYVKGIEETIKEELKEYSVKSVRVTVDKNYENIEKIDIYLEIENQNIEVEPILIETTGIKEKESEEIENFEIKKIVSEKYQIENEKIHIYQK